MSETVNPGQRPDKDPAVYWMEKWDAAQHEIEEKSRLLEKAQGELERLQGEHAGTIIFLEAGMKREDVLKLQVDAMRPVVEAALELSKYLPNSEEFKREEFAFCAAINAYREKTDSLLCLSCGKAHTKASGCTETRLKEKPNITIADPGAYTAPLSQPEIFKLYCPKCGMGTETRRQDTSMEVLECCADCGTERASEKRNCVTHNDPKCPYCEA